jgi:hypothetical protein
LYLLNDWKAAIGVLCRMTSIPQQVAQETLVVEFQFDVSL